MDHCSGHHVVAEKILHYRLAWEVGHRSSRLLMVVVGNRPDNRLSLEGAEGIGLGLLDFRVRTNSEEVRN